MHVQGFETVPCWKGKNQKISGAEFILEDVVSKTTLVLEHTPYTKHTVVQRSADYSMLSKILDTQEPILTLTILSLYIQSTHTTGTQWKV